MPQDEKNIHKLLGEPYWDLEDIQEMKDLISDLSKTKKQFRSRFFTDSELFELFIAIFFNSCQEKNHEPRDFSIQAFNRVKSYMKRKGFVLVKKEVEKVFLERFQFSMYLHANTSHAITQRYAEVPIVKSFLKETNNIQDVFKVYHLYCLLMKEIARDK